MVVQAQGGDGHRRSLGRTALLALLALVAALSLSMSRGVEDAKAETIGSFCWGAGVGPWGQCTAGWGQWLTSVHGKGGQHSGCVNAYHNGALVSSWACGATNEWAFIGYNGARWMQGTVRNNVGVNNVLYGEMWYP